jgi:hypothetical protein
MAINQGNAMILPTIHSDTTAAIETKAAQFTDLIIDNARDAVVTKRIDGEGAVESFLGQIALASSQAIHGITSVDDFEVFLNDTYKRSLQVTEPTIHSVKIGPTAY